MENSNKIQVRAKYIAIGIALVGLAVYIVKTENNKSALIQEIKEHNAHLRYVTGYIDRMERNGAFDKYFR